MTIRTAIYLAACVALLPCLAVAACPYAHANAGLLSSTRSLLDTPAPAYLDAVKTLDLKAVKADIAILMSTSDLSWPSDFGYYGGLFIRLAWHCAGSYRTWDGRGGCDGGRIRFAPESEWPDNTNLDKARKLLEPIKQKYGDKLSWGDLIVIAGNTAVETAGGPVLPLCLGRVDDADGSASIELGPSKEQEAVAPCGTNGACEKPLGPTTLGLIYVNPEGPLGQPKPEITCQQIRDTFSRMGMNDSETVALIGGGHAFGKAHGACPAGPGMCGVGEMKGKGNNTVTSGFEGPWTTDPTRWSNEYFTNLLGYEWVVHKGPGGHFQWRPTATKSTVGVVSSDAGAAKTMPDIMMLTADVSLLKDPAYLLIVNQFAEDQKAFEDAFKAAFYKLTTRDMGPVTRCVNVQNSLPAAYPWQCPLPDAPKDKPDYQKVAAEVSKILTPANTGLLTTLAWQSAATYRKTDHMGGTNGARIRFSPMKDWPDNKGLDEGLKLLQPIKDKFPGLSMADLIVLAGTVALQNPDIKFYGGRVDAAEACVVDGELKPRVYQSWVVSVKDDAKVKGLTLKQYVALFATPRSSSQHKALGYTGTWSESQKLSNAFFQTLLAEKWENSTSPTGVNEFKASGKAAYITPPDAALTQDPELLAVVKELAADNAAFLKQYAESWTAVMNAGVQVDSGVALSGMAAGSKNGAFSAAGLCGYLTALMAAVLAAVLLN